MAATSCSTLTATSWPPRFLSAARNTSANPPRRSASGAVSKPHRAVATLDVRALLVGTTGGEIRASELTGESAVIVELYEMSQTLALCRGRFDVWVAS
jgi:hypothetical protein